MSTKMSINLIFIAYITRTVLRRKAKNFPIFRSQIDVKGKIFGERDKKAQIQL